MIKSAYNLCAEFTIEKHGCFLLSFRELNIVLNWCAQQMFNEHKMNNDDCTVQRASITVRYQTMKTVICIFKTLMSVQNVNHTTTEFGYVLT